MAKIPKEKAEVTRAEKIGKLTREATDYLEKNDGNYKRILGDIIRTLEELVDRKGWTIHGRVKSARSLREKILRKGYYKSYEDGSAVIDELPDLIGVRIQCLLNQEENSAYELLQNKRVSLNEDGFSMYQIRAGVQIGLLLNGQQAEGHLVPLPPQVNQAPFTEDLQGQGAAEEALTAAGLSSQEPQIGQTVLLGLAVPQTPFQGHPACRVLAP